MGPADRSTAGRRRSLFGQGVHQTLGFLPCRFGRAERFFGALARLPLLIELVLPGRSGLLCCLYLGPRIIKLLAPTMSLGAKLSRYISFAAQSFNGLILCQFSVADFCLQVVHEGLHVCQRSFGFLPSGGFSGKSTFSALQATVTGLDGCRCSTMDRQIMTLIAAYNGHRDIAILDETPAMQPTTKTIAAAMRGFTTFRISSVPMPFAHQAKGLSHLRFGLINGPVIAVRSRIRSAGWLLGLGLAAKIFEAKL